jgi:hypothetical protein
MLAHLDFVTFRVEMLESHIGFVLCSQPDINIYD